MLNQLMLRLEYRSHDTVIGRDLYEKCLSHCTRFDRAVGFFASSVFAACPEAFHSFFQHRGRMRIVCCPILDRSDIEAMHTGYRDRPSLLRKPRLDLLSAGRARVSQEAATLTSWLVATGSLEVRIAIRTSDYGHHIYHEKLGLFGDSAGDWVAFAGSANESLSGVEGNFESVDVFRSWMPAERKRVDNKLLAFDLLWQNETAGALVLTFAEAATRGLLKARIPNPKQKTAQEADPEAIPSLVDVGPLSGVEEFFLIPGDLQLRDHQKNGIRKWFDAKGRGLLVMATGAGKTITALAAATKLYEWANAPLLVVIVCPYLHLCSQWIEEARRFGLDPLLCAMDRRSWYEPLSTRLYNLTSGTRRLASVVVSNSTFASEGFQALMERTPAATLLIADEVHHFGAPNLRKTLPERVPFRLGLSATPIRFRDPDGTAAIFGYFGEPVCRYTLKEALRDGVLCPYKCPTESTTISGKL